MSFGKTIAITAALLLSACRASPDAPSTAPASEAGTGVDKAGHKAEGFESTELKLAVAPGLPVAKIENADLHGQPVDFSEKPTLISFFFSQCAPCIKEIPLINASLAENPEIQFVSLTFDDKSATQAFVSKYGLQTRVVAEEQAFIDAMGVTSYPTYILVGKDGRLLGAQSGATFQLPNGKLRFEQWLKLMLRA